MKRPTHATETQRLDAKLERAIERFADAGGLDPSVTECAARFLRGIPNRRTALTYSGGLVRYLAWCVTAGVDPFAARPSDGKLFNASLADLAPNTRASYLAAVRSFYLAAEDDGLTTATPLARVRTRSQTVTPTPSLAYGEFRAVLLPLATKVRGGTATLVEHRDLALLLLAGRLGPRSVSCRKATWSGWRERPPRWELAIIEKNGGGHVLEVPSDVAEVIEGWRARLAEAIGRPLRPGDAIFPSIGTRPELRRLARRQLEPMSIDSMTQLARRRFLAAGVAGPRLAFHALRATAATIARDHKVEIETIQRMLGHKSPAQTMAYIRTAQRGSAADHWTLDLDKETAA